jgi:hypothetical protein
MIQIIIVGVIVAAAVVGFVVHLVRQGRGEGGCNCGCANCPYSGKKHCPK